MEGVQSGLIIRLIAVLPLLSGCALAQFFGLATPSDGSRLYFATPLRQKSTTQPDYGKLFRIDAYGLSLQESRVYQAPTPGPSGIGGVGYFSFSNAYDVQAADVSSDGDVAAITARLDCAGNAVNCSKVIGLYVTTITTAGGSQDYSGTLRLSADGNWAFGGADASSIYMISFGDLVNLTTGAQTLLNNGLLSLVRLQRFQVAGRGHPVSNDGTAVFCDGGAVVVLKGSQVVRIPIPNGGKPSDAVIDAGATTIVYSVVGNTGTDGVVRLNGVPSLQSTNLASGISTLLDANGYAPSITDDGQTVLYLSSRGGTPQLWLIHSDGSGNRELTHHPLGIVRAILSGDGSTAYAVTFGGQLLKIAVTTGETQELIQRTPFIDANQSTAPGKLTTFTGEGLSNTALTAAPPLPYTLDDVVGVTIQGKPTRILSIQPTSLTVLTPDVTATSFYRPTPLHLEVASPSPFAGPTLSVSIVGAIPEFLRRSDRRLLAAHEDWSAVVTADNPARPGEVVHAYATGLGATSPDVPYGAPAPAQEPLARLSGGFRCSDISNRANEVQVLFAGLAPNLAGLYQIDWRIPLDLSAGDFSLYCRFQTGLSSESSRWGRRAFWRPGYVTHNGFFGIAAHEIAPAQNVQNARPGPEGPMEPVLCFRTILFCLVGEICGPMGVGSSARAAREPDVG